MYAIRIDGTVGLRTNDPLSEYARIEYRPEDVHWLRAAADAARKASRTRRPFRLFRRRAHPAARPVACKGSPRRLPEEVPSSA